MKQFDLFDTIAEAIKPAHRFNGPEYEPEFDCARLTGQLLRIYNLMIDGKFRTLDEIHKITNDPHASISAQLRHLKKERFGSHILNKKSRGDRENGLWEYQVLKSENNNGYTP